jgi:hypothetical protein
MFTNHTNITLFCSKQQGRETIWTSHRLSDVNFHGSDQLIVGDKESNSSDEYIIRVPAVALENYVDNKTYKALPVEEAFNCFTLKKGDYIVKNFVYEDVSTIGEILKSYDAFQITQVTENLNASPYSKHIKLVVK